MQNQLHDSTDPGSQHCPPGACVHLAALIESTQDLIWSVDLDYRLGAFNTAVAQDIEKNWGVTPRPGMTPFDLLPQAQASVWPAMYARVLTDGPYRTEYALRDGRWLELSFNPITADGATIGISVFGKDITERKLADEFRKGTEKRLRESEARFRSYFNLPLVGMAMTSPAKGFIAVNDHICEILGYSRAELLRIGWAQLTHPDDLQANVDQFQRMMAGEVDGYSLNKRFVRKNGQTVWTTISVGCVRKTDGTVDYACLNVQDISERTTAEKAMQSSESRFRTLFEKSPIAIGFSRNGKFLYVNPMYRAIFGLGSAQEVIGQPVVERWAPEERAKIEEVIRRAVTAPGVPISFEATGLRADGSRFPASVNASNMELPEGPANFAFVTDITEQKRAEEALLASETRFRTLVESSPSAICITRVGVLLYVNQRFAQTFGYRYPDELIQTHVDRLFEPETQAQLLEARRRYLAGEIRMANLEGTGVRIDGSQFPFYAEMRVVDLPDGQAVLSFLDDVTNRKDAEEAIREAERQYRDIFTEAPEGIFRVTMAGKLLAMNLAGARMLAYESPEEVLARGDDVARLMWRHPEQRANYVGLLEENGEIHDYQCEFKRQDGSPLWVSLSARKVLGKDGRTLYYQGFFENLSEKKRLEEELKDHIREIQLLSEMNSALLHATTEEDLLREYCRIVVETGGYRMAWVGFANPGPEKRVIPVAHYGFEDGYLETVKITWDDSEYGCGVVGQAIKSGRFVTIAQVQGDKSMHPWHGEAGKRGYESSIAIPFRHSDKGVGCLTAYDSQAHTWSQSELRLMEQIGAALAFGITTVRTAIARDLYQRDLHASLEQTIKLISETVEQRDPYTAGHQRRVADLCARIAEKLGLDVFRIQGLRLAATIHDLGKIAIPAEILAKPGRLTPIQFALIKEHAELGYDIVKNVIFPWPIADIIRQHHERLDGSGYPRGLQGDSILLEARILAVADVVEAMGSHRPYRATRGIEAALAEVLAQRGRLYDPDSVDACMTLFQKEEYVFPA